MEEFEKKNKKKEKENAVKGVWGGVGGRISSIDTRQPKTATWPRRAGRRQEIFGNKRQSKLQ